METVPDRVNGDPGPGMEPGKSASCLLYNARNTRLDVEKRERKDWPPPRCVPHACMRAYRLSLCCCLRRSARNCAPTRTGGGLRGLVCSVRGPSPTFSAKVRPGPRGCGADAKEPIPGILQLIGQPQSSRNATPVKQALTCST
jgi:hypothetical protein